MAAGCGADKENAAPAASSAAASAVARQRCYSVKRAELKKRPCRARWPGRVPLRDITNLIAASSASAEPEALLMVEGSTAAAELAKPDLVLPVAAGAGAAVRDGAGAAAAVGKAGRYSLRKGFR
ncbi:hypothetical protein ACP4OV_013014 [Aristida adscensionis]